MSPKKRQGDQCCGQSRTHLRLKYGATKSEGDNLSRIDYSERILHRLRPRIYRQKIVSEACKPRKRRKKTRPPIKSCFINKRKRRFDKSRNLRGNMDQKSAGDVRSGNIFLGTIQTPDIAKKIPRDTNQRIKSRSFIQTVKDYVYSTIKEATNYVYRTFVRSENKSDEIDDTRKRYRAKNDQHNDCPRNLSADNFGNLKTVSDVRQRLNNVIANLSTVSGETADVGNGRNFWNKTGKKEPNTRKKRKKGSGRRNKWIVRDVIRYKKNSRKARKRRTQVRNDPASVNYNKKDKVDNLLKDINKDIGLGESGYQKIESIGSENERMKNGCLNRFEEKMKDDK